MLVRNPVVAGRRPVPSARGTPQAAHRITGRGVARRLHKVTAFGSRWGRSCMRQSSPPATGLPRVHCVVHSGGDLHAIHTAIRVMLGAARTRTGDRRRAWYRRRHTGHDVVERCVHEAIAARTVARTATGSGSEPQPDRRRRQPQARPAPSCAVAAGRQSSWRGAPRVGAWWTRHRHVASALLCKDRFTDLRFHRKDAFWGLKKMLGGYPPGYLPRKNKSFSHLPGSHG